MTPQERDFWVRRMGARRAWWERHQEDIIATGCEVIDAHFHLWEAQELPDPLGKGNRLRTSRYMLEEFLQDAHSGHDVSACIYVECGSGRLTKGPEHLRSTGETQFAVSMTRQLTRITASPQIKAIVAHADLRHPNLKDVLDLHRAKGAGLFRGIRQSIARLDDPAERLIAGAAAPGLSSDPDFRRGVALLGEHGLTFDAFQFHFQLPDLVNLAREASGTTIIINHLGGPVGFARNRTVDDATFASWAHSIERLAELPNVTIKLGGMASIVTGYDGHLRETPPSSSDFVAERGAWFHHAIKCFGPERCMFGTNFPVDSTSISYRVLWNAFKMIAAEYGTAGRKALLSETARSIYRL